MLYITEKAANKIREISDDEGIGYYIVRAKVLGKGCSGFGFDIYFDDQINEMDEITEFDGIKIVVDSLSFQYLDEATVDFMDGQFESGFKFLSAKITGSCGCSQSVSF